MNKEVKVIIGVAVIAWGSLYLTGCGTGYEIGARAGVYRVDEQRAESRSHRADNKPLKCWFFPCASESFEK